MATSRFRKSSVPTLASTALDKPRIILGIDPGTQLLGFGVVRAVGKKADELAIESPFYGKNAQVVLKLGRAQGAAIIAALESGVSSVTEYAPRKAKEAIVGNGAASKEQVQLMLEKTLGVKLAAEHLDATDALAIALCHHFQTTNPLSSVKGKGGWEQFLKDHPDRIQ